MQLTKGMKKEYQKLFETMRIKPSTDDVVKSLVDYIFKHKVKYLSVQRLTGVPWMMIATIHCLEGGLSFKNNLHNGQRWNRVTTIKPIGKGPFINWSESAIDAMTDLKVEMVKLLSSDFKWDVATIAYSFELHNGWGYRKYRGIYSPYLWSFSNHYSKGKYAYDGKYDPNLVSKQVGAMVIYKSLFEHQIKIRERETEELLAKLGKVEPITDHSKIINREPSPDAAKQYFLKTDKRYVAPPIKKLSKIDKMLKCFKSWF